MDSYDFDKLRAALPLPELMQRLGLGEHAKKAAFCPFHENTATPSFSVYQKESGRAYWKCHSTCGGGDEVDLLEKHLGLSKPEALKHWKELAGGAVHSKPVSPCRVQRAPAPALTREPVAMPSDLHDGTRDELETVARLRGVDFGAVATMKQNEVIKFGTVCGVPCWILGDRSRRIAEARRMDGAKFPSFDGGAERKVHTLRGSEKRWPLGLMLPKELHKCFPCVLLVEGSGDFVAAYHFVHAAAETGSRWLPVAMAGASNHIHPEALPILRGKRVKIVPHFDEAGGAGALKWAEELKRVGCQVSGFNLKDLRKSDGSPVKDLNDCADVHPEDAGELGGLLK
jgi:hypothetical protein